MFNASDLMKRTPSQIDDILAAMGTGRDRIVAHINPREAAILKALGGSGTINPRTGMLQFDDGDGGDSGGDGMGGDGMGGFGGGDGGFGGFGGGGDSLGGWGGSGDMGGGWGGFGEGFGGLGDATGGFASGIGGYDNTSDVLGTWGGWGVDFGGLGDTLSGWGVSDVLGTWGGWGVDFGRLGDTLSGWGYSLGDYLGSLGIGAPSTPGVTDAIGGDVDAGWSTTGYQEGTPENAASMAGLESYGQATSPASYDKTDRGLDMISGFPGFSTMMNYAPSSMMGIGGFVGDPLGSLSSAAKGLGKAAGIAGLSSLLGIAAAPVAGPLAAALVGWGISPGVVGSLYGIGTTALGRSAYEGLEEAISGFDPGTVNMGDYATADTGGTPGESFGGMDLSGATSIAGALDSGSPDALSAPTPGIQARGKAPDWQATNWKDFNARLASMGRGGGMVTGARANEATARGWYDRYLRENGYA